MQESKQANPDMLLLHSNAGNVQRHLLSMIIMIAYKLVTNEITTVEDAYCFEVSPIWDIIVSTDKRPDQMSVFSVGATKAVVYMQARKQKLVHINTLSQL